MSNLKVTTGIIPDNCIEENAVEISEFRVTYTQPADTNSPRDAYQNLTVVAENNGVDWYLSFQTETKWSIDSPNDIKVLLEDFLERMNHNTVKKEDLKIM